MTVFLVSQVETRMIRPNLLQSSTSNAKWSKNSQSAHLCCRRGYFNVVPVKIRANEHEVSSYAFLDLGLDKPKRLTLSTLGHRHDTVYMKA